ASAGSWDYLLMRRLTGWNLAIQLYDSEEPSKWFAFKRDFILRVNPTCQFYLACAQLNVVNGGSANPSPLVSFPGAYKATDPGILINIYSLPSGFTGYKAQSTDSLYRRS
ncbi:hypothetical protein PIIN_10315, partial [Serendipita indica DSM 11827]